MSVFAYSLGRSTVPPRVTLGRPTSSSPSSPPPSGTRLTVTESGFAQLPDEWLEASYQGNVEGWRSELAKLVAYLDAA